MWFDSKNSIGIAILSYKFFKFTIYKAEDLQPIENGILIVETNKISSKYELYSFLPK
jgi:hypothetical protein